MEALPAPIAHWLVGAASFDVVLCSRGQVSIVAFCAEGKGHSEVLMRGMLSMLLMSWRVKGLLIEAGRCDVDTMSRACCAVKAMHDVQVECTLDKA